VITFFLDACVVHSVVSVIVCVVSAVADMMWVK